MLDPVIQNFLDFQKSEWLKKNIKKNMAEDDKTRVEKKSDNDFSLSPWLEKMLDVARSFYCSHPAKFTHSTPLLKRTRYKAKDLNIVAKFDFVPDGLLKSGNAHSEIDLTGYPDNGDSTSLYGFLNLRLGNGLTTIQNLEADSEYIQKQLSNCTTDYEVIRNTLAPKVMGTIGVQRYTSGRLKQVYFPVGEKYHLLSIVSPSGLMFRVKKYIDTLHFSDATKKARESRRKNEAHESYSEVFDLTYIGFGGSNKQNVSVLNNQNGGITYLLSSMPPKLEKRYTNPPRDNFFGKFLYPKYYLEGFEKLHAALCNDHNNIHVRNRIKWLIKEVAFQVIDRSWEVRYLPAGWSDSEHYQSLPESQKIWLDQKYRNQRQENLEWLDEIKIAMTRWLINSYQSLLGNKAYHLADIEFIKIKALLDECEEGLK